jgi:SNF2 family DNA or RNA helicase
VNGKTADNARVKTTLIVASPSLVGQWQDEIRTHCQSKRENKHGIGLVFQHRAGKRIHSNQDDEVLASADIILTTYQEVMKSYPKANPPPQLTTAVQKDAYWKKLWDEERGVLHRMKFLRVVLDEASAIKNHKSHTSMACRALDSKHYWAISGTPVQNTLQEFYPYFKFLREPTTGSYKIFKENYCTEDDNTGKERLNAMLRKIMIRRTHIDRLFNARLLDLPTPHQHTIWLEFNDVERQVYDIVRRRFIERINTMSRDAGPGGFRKKFSHVWTMVLRLRQICASVLLIFESCLPLLEREDFEKLNSITTGEDDMSEEGVALLLHLRNVLRNNNGADSIEGGITGSVLTENEAVATGVVDIDQNIEGESGGKHGTSYRFRKYLEAFRKSDGWEDVVAKTLCCGCRSPPYEPYVTSCSHIFCHGCLKDLQSLAARRGHDLAKCSECGETYSWSRPCIESMQVRPTSASSTEIPTKKGAKSRKREGEIDWLGLKGEILPSAKTLGVKAQVLEWLSKDPEVKVIIYTQWIPFLRILGRICHTEGWSYCTYSGKITTEAREAAINDFSRDPEKRILLASLKCGGLGLNITAASRVILIDPWWNQAVEQQAFCRGMCSSYMCSSAILTILYCQFSALDNKKVRNFSSCS